MLSYENFSVDPFEDWRPTDEWKGARTILEWAYHVYQDSLIYSCSMGAEGMVLIDLISQVKEDANLLFLDTELHFPETYKLIDRVKSKYPRLQIKMKKPELSLEDQSAEHGSALWKRNPDQCCYIRKVKPLEEELSSVTAWISGLRREQSLSRAKTNFVNKDRRFQSIKICPLIYWTWEDVWQYIHQHQVPYNELHEYNFPSIGCIPCTSAVEDGVGDSRAGRWQGTNKTECGLHPSLEKED
ncbi:phosphoadenylyl-sulfate reductase [Radiobacillus deserti]|uniref:Adenosine 5'-phosphosulfate reductase n=1 Tax=Radiobacillus deserti TaxID=2594883 RepID=A0A516KLA9_9BACI|nr:phosphoadenylyl-sulfate reductase [Radiobacillus deserti]QDP42180.1 phosphoadenylyl-sulfate reductase [Radiobacillus deserti]